MANSSALIGVRYFANGIIFVRQQLRLSYTTLAPKLMPSAPFENSVSWYGAVSFAVIWIMIR
jgi:hypothetical protein